MFTYELSILSTINCEFESFGISAIDDGNGIVQGRPYLGGGGMRILIRKSYGKHAEFNNFNDSRIVGITLSLDSLQNDFISVTCLINVIKIMICICNVLVNCLH